MQAVITLKEALELMRTGEPFDLVWTTADRQRRRGGEILTAKEAQLPTKRTKENGKRKTENASRSGTNPLHPQWTGSVPAGNRTVDERPSSVKRNPNHYANGTRNIRLANGKVRKVHIQLIDSINGMKVV